MADKDSILIIEVDLACNTCCNKIQKVLCKMQVKESIKSISYDTKKNEVTISGAFNPHQLYHKLRCKAGCVIKGHRIPDKKKEEEEKKKKEEEEKKKKKEEEEKKKKKEEEEKKKKEEAEKKKKEEEEKKKAAATASANTTVNLQFTQVCFICYPWPCSDPIGHCQQRHCEGVKVPAGNHHQRPPTCGVPPTCNTCAGPPCSGGCGSCGGGGGWWPSKPLPSICCPGPSCRGCNGCRVVHEQKYEYHEYPPSACIVM